MAPWTNNEVTIHPMTLTFCFAHKFLKNYVHAAIFLCIFRVLPNFCTPTFSNNNLPINKYAFTVLVACSRIPCMSRGPPVDDTYTRIMVHRNTIPCIYLRSFTLLINPVGNWCPIGVIRTCRFQYHGVYRAPKRIREQYEWSTLEGESHGVHSPSEISDTVWNVLKVCDKNMFPLLSNACTNNYAS